MLTMIVSLGHILSLTLRLLGTILVGLAGAEGSGVRVEGTSSRESLEPIAYAWSQHAMLVFTVVRSLTLWAVNTETYWAKI